jgi:serine/threonine protein kinase
MTYPQIIDYNEAVQDPANAFLDPQLKAGRVAETPLGLPLALSGGFALTYRVTSGSKQFAVRCFHRAVPDVERRYAAISATLRRLASPYFVNFEFQSEGIRVQGKPYPIVKMEWAEGDTLGVYLDRAVSNPSALAGLRSAFRALAVFLERNGIAHGDIQNENVVVENGALRLIDYDGMFVPGMEEGRGTEVGHKHFQHPEREPKHFGPRMDHFSFIVVEVSLEALQAEPGLYARFREGGQTILFRANDFKDPASSDVFRILRDLEGVRESAAKLAAICRSPISDVPKLSDFIQGRNIPRPAGPVVASPGPRPSPRYIGPFDVIDATDFAAVLRRVGDKVELVGQIVSVKAGVAKRGRGRGNPYVFINFGVWHRDSVKVTIWSEGLQNMTTRPTEAWVGRWVSVTGLVEPPYQGEYYGRPYRNVGITVTSDSQIVHLSEEEAKFRLGKGETDRWVAAGWTTYSSEGIPTGLAEAEGHRNWAAKPRGLSAPTSTPTCSPQLASMSARTKNEKILQRLQAAQGTGTATYAGSTSTHLAQPPTTTGKAKNEAILKGLRTPLGTGTGTPGSPTPSQPVPPPGLLARLFRFLLGK